MRAENYGERSHQAREIDEHKACDVLAVSCEGVELEVEEDADDGDEHQLFRPQLAQRLHADKAQQNIAYRVERAVIAQHGDGPTGVFRHGGQEHAQCGRRAQIAEDNEKRAYCGLIAEEFLVFHGCSFI